ncbi:MAG: mechanosensitive ion channel domain-containing protein [Pseudomonadota bacterium]
MIDFFKIILMDYGLDKLLADIIVRSCAFVLIIIISFIADMLSKKFIGSMTAKLAQTTENKWDDILIKRKVFNRLSHMAPAFILYMAMPFILKGYPTFISALNVLVLIYVILVSIFVIDSLLNALLDIYSHFKVSKEIPLKGLIQISKIIIFFLGAILIISIIIGKSPFYLLSGLGALTAVLLLIFKDSILGFIAGIQLATNKMIAVGDWISMPQYEADGDVIDVSLTTIKVQNWDKTITTIPAYALISESFKNWKGMEASGGRRIKRKINIDVNTIKFCTEKMFTKFKQIEHLKPYLEKKEKEIIQYNTDNKVDLSCSVNGRRLTNIGTLRAYIGEYLKKHPMINQDMTFLIRHLPVEENGLPLEVYVFCKDKAWANYESIIADIFDHILAVIPEFDLRIFQTPSGFDFKAALSGKQ